MWQRQLLKGSLPLLAVITSVIIGSRSMQGGQKMTMPRLDRDIKISDGNISAVTCVAKGLQVKYHGGPIISESCPVQFLTVCPDSIIHS